MGDNNLTGIYCTRCNNFESKCECLTVDDILDFISEHFDAPCGMRFNGKEAIDTIADRYGEDYCHDNCSNDYKKCWEMFLKAYKHERMN